jgi:hypothetical protein
VTFAGRAFVFGAGGTVLSDTTIGLQHELRHTFGGSFDLPHAEGPGRGAGARAGGAARDGADRRRARRRDHRVASSTAASATARRPGRRRSACAKPTSTTPPISR